MTAAEPAAVTAVRQPSSARNIWLISREYGKLAGVGGVKDVVKQLACALARSGRQVKVVIPCYGFMNPGKLGFTRLTSFKVELSYAQEERHEQVSIWQRQEEVAIYLVDSPRFREKGDIYTYTAAEARRNPGKLGFTRLTSFKVELSYAQEERYEQVSIWQRREGVTI
ncbi:MAG: glycogen/starch synthase, partial [Deltaproteobacteria bacterium]|nr:glycogen/starch synthase [Deltaproteobacteria bacterium]